MTLTKLFASAAFAAACAWTPLVAQTKTPDMVPVTDAEFVIKAASGGMFEVESSKVAKEMSKSDDVKKFAEMMIEDHGKASKELMAAAKEANVGLPVKMLDADQKMLDMVKAAKGADFDKTFAKAQLKAHEDAVALFMNASKNVKDAKLKAFAEKTLPTLKGHLEHVQKHVKMMDKDTK